MVGVEALWSVAFQSSDGWIGAGVVVLETERVLGGDGSFTYIGKYSIASGVVRARVDVKRYNDMATTSVFPGLSEFTLNVEGKFDRDAPNRMICSGSIVDQPNRQIVIEFTRRAELP
jgi:hypothetical protein